MADPLLCDPQERCEPWCITAILTIAPLERPGLCQTPAIWQLFGNSNTSAVWMERRKTINYNMDTQANSINVYSWEEIRPGSFRLSGRKMNHLVFMLYFVNIFFVCLSLVVSFEVYNLTSTVSVCFQ